MVRAGPRSTGQIRNYGFRVVHEALKSTNAYTKVVERINEPDVETQKNSLVLINSLFSSADGQEKSELMERLDLLSTRKTMIVRLFLLLSSKGGILNILILILQRLMQSTSSAEVSREIINFQMTYHSYLTLWVPLHLMSSHSWISDHLFPSVSFFLLPVRL